MDFSKYVSHYATNLAQAVEARQNVLLRVGQSARDRMDPIEELIERLASETQKIIPGAKIESERPEVDPTSQRVMYRYRLEGGSTPETLELEVRGNGVFLNGRGPFVRENGDYDVLADQITTAMLGCYKPA